MKASVHWLNQYLRPADLDPLEADRALTDAGFPIDAREDLPSGDARLEVEVTSNRGDCLSHTGLAREIAAKTGRQFVPPRATDPGPATSVSFTSPLLSLDNTLPDLCPRFTLRIIQNVKVGPSPAWLAERLESVGQRPINNIVDITNFINFELGNPCHAFDLDKLAGRKVIVRYAREGETLATLDGKQRTLKADEVVVADGERAQSLAGVIGGGDSEVSASTRNIAFEVATWDPAAVRRAARRHQVRTDAGHRFERIVDPRTLDAASLRGAQLIAELASGSLLPGMLDAGRPAQPLHTIHLRAARVGSLLGIALTPAEIAETLVKLEIAVELKGDAIDPTLLCTIPPFRPDLTREIDLIEEVARIRGLDRIPAHERMSVVVHPPQASERAAREIGSILTGLGFYETVTFSFVTPRQAKPFLAPGQSALAVDDERRKGEGTLRPSITPSLLICRKANQDGGVEIQGGVRLYETAHTFAERTSPAETARESRVLSLLIDIPGVGKGKPGAIEERQTGVRILRGALESLARAMAGPAAAIELRPAPPAVPAFDAAAHAQVLLNGAPIGHLGIISADTQRLFDLAIPVVAAELDLAALTAPYPPMARAHALPAFPDIERDLSLIVAESVRWEQVRKLVESANPDKLEGLSFVGAYRGRPIPPGHKSLTLRLRFRDPTRTLRHEEVDPQIAALVARAAQDLGATLRA